MPVQTPVLDVVDTFHVPREVLSGDAGVANHAIHLGKLRRPLALVFSMPDVIVVLTLLAVVATHLVVLDPGHCRKQTAAVAAGILKENRQSFSTETITNVKGESYIRSMISISIDYNRAQII